MDWNSSALWGIIGLIGGLAVSSFFYFIGIKRKSLIYEITTTTLVSNNSSELKDLTIKYRNRSINDLYVSTIKIKNNGNSIIEHKDFAPSAPLTIETTGDFFIDSQEDIDKTTQLFSENEYNKVFPQVEIKENNICKRTVINFDYISKKETITCSVFHTGKVSVKGKLKEGKIIEKKEFNNFIPDTNFAHTLMSALISGLVSFLITLLLFIFFNQFEKKYTDDYVTEYIQKYIEEINNE